MRLVLDEPQPIESLRKVYNDHVTFVTSTSSWPLVSEIQFKGDYQSTLRKRQVPVKVGKRVDREITKYEKKLKKVWDYYQTRINRIIRFEDIKLIRELLRSNKDTVEKRELTLARVLRERSPQRRFILRQKFLQQNKARLIQSQLDEMKQELQRVSRPAFKTVFKLGKIRGQIQSDQELDDRLTVHDRRLLSEKEEWNSKFLNNLTGDSWNHYEGLLAMKFDEPDELINALEEVEKKERSRLPLFAAAIASVLLAAGTARAARDVTTDPKTGEEQEEAILDEETGIPVGIAYKGGLWHTRHDNRVCPGCEGNDGKWMTNNDFQAEAGTNECLTRCRCIELFELAEKPVNKNEIWRGQPGASIKDWPRFRKSTSILRKLYPALVELQDILNKHLQGEHDQQRHDPTRGGGAGTKPGKSGFVTAFKDRTGAYVEVLRNPSRKELHEIESWEDEGAVRAMLTESGDLLYWDARTLHHEARDVINLKEEVVPIVVGNNYIYITDNVKNSFGGGVSESSTVFYEKVKQAGDIVRRHKDKLKNLIGEFEIDHYGSQIEGNVIEQPYKVQKPEGYEKVIKVAEQTD